MSQGTLLVALDLGTATTTARFVRVWDTYDAGGRVHRQSMGNRPPVEMKNWPGGYKGDTIGKQCLPTDLVYDRFTGDLLFWGFEAQRYLDDPVPEISLDRVLVVQHIKLLLNDPDKAKVQTAATARYRKLREEIFDVLEKSPFDLFEDFLNVVLNEVAGTVKLYYHAFIPSRVELALAFPSGWSDSIHRQVAAIGARAMEKALAANQFENVAFAIENVYTVSETLCGVKEWLTTAMDDAGESIDLKAQSRNIDELNEGDTFVAVDIGGGTGCMTVLKLISKKPLQVDQLGQTQSLEVSGEAVEAEFRRILQLMISPEDYDGDIERLIDRICRLFKEEKKGCSPTLGNSTWNISVEKLRVNPAKGFYSDHIRIDRKRLEASFNPAVDILLLAIEETLRMRPEIKTIIFLGNDLGKREV
ncbi:hypothetical protein BKA65DRAFT_273898 [Rhexocercosporidium sp. MPI-PUGE-AT-0058]|nr:hypothetical protein BKA65DRAFT_273898 [Rhexocercosporidium sp. MPI-PUGE-AT-0058]